MLFNLNQKINAKNKRIPFIFIHNSTRTMCLKKKNLNNFCKFCFCTSVITLFFPKPNETLGLYIISNSRRNINPHFISVPPEHPNLIHERCKIEKGFYYSQRQNGNKLKHVKKKHVARTKQKQNDISEETKNFAALDWLLSRYRCGLIECLNRDTITLMLSLSVLFLHFTSLFFCPSTTLPGVTEPLIIELTRASFLIESHEFR